MLVRLSFMPSVEVKIFLFVKVISMKDQAQYRYRTEQSYEYVSVDTLSRMFRESSIGKKLNEEMSQEFIKSDNHKKSISHSVYSVSKWTLFKACMSREIILMRRNSFIYKFKTIQVILHDFFCKSDFYYLNSCELLNSIDFLSIK